MIIPSRSQPRAGPAALGIVLAAALLVILAMIAPAVELPVPSSGVLLAGALAVSVGGLLLVGGGVAERLVLLYIFLTPFQFELFGTSLVPQRDEAFGFRVSLSDLVLPLLVLALLQRRPDRGSVLRSRLGLLFVALAVAVAASWGQSVLHLGAVTRFASGKVVGLMALVVLAAALVEVIRDRRLWDRALDTLALSGVASGIIGIGGWLLWTLGGVSTYLMDFDRLNSTMFGDPNIFASLMGVTLILAAVRIGSGTPLSRGFWATCAAIALVALALTQSRSGLIAAAVGLAVLVPWLARPRVTVAGAVTLVLLGVAGFAGYLSAGAPGAAAITGSQRFSGETLDSRLELWERGADLLWQEPVAGIGIGSFEQTTFFEGSGRLRSGFARAHNTYLTIPVEFGLVGALVFTLLGMGVIRAVREAKRQMDSELRMRLAAAAAALVAMLAFAMWVDALFQRHLWILVGLILASPRIAEHARASANSGEATPLNGGQS